MHAHIRKLKSEQTAVMADAAAGLAAAGITVPSAVAAVAAGQFPTRPAATQPPRLPIAAPAGATGSPARPGVPAALAFAGLPSPGGPAAVNILKAHLVRLDSASRMLAHQSGGVTAAAAAVRGTLVAEGGAGQAGGPGVSLAGSGRLDVDDTASIGQPAQRRHPHAAPPLAVSPSATRRSLSPRGKLYASLLHERGDAGNA
jgi:hypothetical protein